MSLVGDGKGLVRHGKDLVRNRENHLCTGSTRPRDGEDDGTWPNLFPLRRLGGFYRTDLFDVSVAQYNEQNGEAMRDREITFLVVPSEKGITWTPLTFGNSYPGAYQVVAEVKKSGSLGGRQLKPMQEPRNFAIPWDINLKQQEVGEAFEQHS
jgi:hypothetical protein